MRARLHDPIGPWWSRAVLPAIAGVCMTLGTYWYETHGPPMSFGFFVGLAILLLAPLLLGRNRPRIVELALHAGRVVVRRGGILGQTIRAKNVLAASTARTEVGVSLALVCKHQSAPLLLELEGEDQAKTVCDALGIGHHGFGLLRWERDRRPIDRSVQITRIVTALVWIVYGFAAQASAPAPMTALLLMLLPFTAFSLLGSRRGSGTGITLDVSERGVGVIGPGARRQLVPFTEIEDARRTERGLELVTTGGADHARATIVIPIETQSHLQRGMTGAEVEHALAQIQSASARARGQGAPRTDVTERLDVLRRGSDDARAWLSRIDALADRMKLSQPGYRDASIEREDLWTAVRDHDGDPELRAAAARILVRIDPAVAGPQVDAIVAAVRDPHHAQMIRIAPSEDVDDVVRELEELEELETHAVRR